MSDVRTPPPWHPKQLGSPPGRVRVTRLCGYLNLHQIPISSCNNVDLTGRDRGSEPLRSFPSEPRSRVKCVHRPLLESHFLGCGRRTSFPNASVFPSVTRDFWASGGAIRLDQLLISSPPPSCRTHTKCSLGFQTSGACGGFTSPETRASETRVCVLHHSSVPILWNQTSVI